ncbi:MetQ/NlpA family ABC transporter substrate-binding protein [Bifidobacterium xylocopae]|uniref:ABC transporter substrate-binding protein n=1 Tax=Bifidobacterium xylocopae TaxID=2493119 RepID=A0A366KGP0_9BIFI|nr:MetQ/NlpA family ABC transporter substrate-binding protein [Bifidobacterium xylocopae]RBP99851.1 ABC transporter substrate-binding protein [Bifidobacterium xylocopae]
MARKSSGRKRRAKVELTVLSALIVLALVAVCGVSYRLHGGHEGDTEVRIAVIGSSDDQIWQAVQTELDRRGDRIHITLKPFQDAIYLDQVLSNREVDLNAGEHYAFLESDIKTNGYRLTPIGDTYISPMNLYSKRYRSAHDFPEGAKVAIPNNTTNMGRALKVLERAGLIGLRDPKTTTPVPEDIVDNPNHLVIEQTDPAGIVNLLPDYAGGVVNANFVIDAGMKVTDAIYQVPYDLKDPANHPYVNIIVANSDRRSDPVCRKVVAAYHSKAVADTINRIYKGASVPAFAY